jgi:uncharacterized protein (TIGR00725 family)
MIRTGKIPELIDPRAMYTSNGQEAWRVLGIMAEFAAATERLQGVRPAVSLFGSARIRQGHPYYQRAERIARLLSDAGFAVISGGGPGLMEAANRGAHAGKSPAIGLNILLPREQGGNDFQDVGFDFRYFFARKMMFVRFASAYVVMAGGKDAKFAAIARDMAGRIPRATLRIVPETGHAVALERVPEFAAELEEFLKGSIDA